MGHQVNFYLTPTDTKALEKSWNDVGPLVILHSRSPTAAPRILEAIDFEVDGRPWLYFYLARPEDVQAVVTKSVPTQGYWTVDVRRSPVVEFNRCFFDATVLRRGRLYYVDDFYDADSRLKKKDASFLKWAKSILSTTKKSLRRIGPDYIGADAESWAAASKIELAQQ